MQFALRRLLSSLQKHGIRRSLPLYPESTVLVLRGYRMIGAMAFMLPEFR